MTKNTEKQIAELEVEYNNITTKDNLEEWEKSHYQHSQNINLWQLGGGATFLAFLLIMLIAFTFEIIYN